MIGVVANNQWSVSGAPLRPAVNTFLAQPFINYNMAHGWFLTTSPIITSNWLAAPGQEWTVPIGGGFGRVFSIGDQPHFIGNRSANAKMPRSKVFTTQRVRTARMCPGR